MKKNPTLTKNMPHVKWDQIPPLSGPDPRGLINETKQDKPELFAKKIKKICSSRQSIDFMVIARIESFILGKGLKDALKRAEIYSKSGVISKIIKDM